MSCRRRKFVSSAGADQLGLLLLSRAANRLQYELPLVNVTYAAGMGGKTVPTYEDDTVAVSASSISMRQVPSRYIRAKMQDLVLLSTLLPMV